MPSQEPTARELESADWERVQEIVRTYRQAVDRDEQPALEAFVAEANGNGRAALVELIHEEMEFRIKAGESFSLATYLERFPDIADDPHALDELAAAESALRRRIAPELREELEPTREKRASRGGAGAYRPVRAAGGGRTRGFRGRLPGMGHRALSRGRSQAAPARAPRRCWGGRSIPPRGPQRGRASSIRTSCRCTTSARSMECHSWSAR